MIRPVSSVVSAAASVGPEASGPVISLTAGVAEAANTEGSVAGSSADGWTISTGAVDTVALRLRGVGVFGAGSATGSAAPADDDDG